MHSALAMIALVAGIAHGVAVSFAYYSGLLLL